MLRLADFDIVVQEVPNETTLALNLSECPNRCPGCHSLHLWEATGDPLTIPVLDDLLERYPYVTCVAIMGGDNDPASVLQMAQTIRQRHRKVAWYSGANALPADWTITAAEEAIVPNSDESPLACFDFIKVGPYVEALGGLKCRTTNQRFYRVENGRLIDCTEQFWH